jgi:hypothetical protein
MKYPQIISTYQDPEVRNIESLFRQLEKLELRHNAGMIPTGEFLKQWDNLSHQIHPND